MDLSFEIGNYHLYSDNNWSSQQGSGGRGGGSTDVTTSSPPTVTVPNGDFSTPTVPANSVLGLNGFTSTSSITYQTWSIACTFTSGGQFNAFLDHITFPSGLSELSTSYPQCIQFAPDHCAGAITLSQPITFTQAGTYQLSFYAAPYANAYQTYYTMNASVGSTSMGAFSLSPTAGWVNYTMNFVVGAAGSETLAFVFNFPSNANSVGVFLAAVTITYVSA
jgi:hypothetical protein